MKNQVIENNCPCCAEFLNKGIFVPYRQGRCLAQSNNFVILPAIGSLIYPYLIIEPKFHVCSFSKLSNKLLAEANKLLLNFLKPIEKKYKIILAEHGENFKSLEHAHIHIILFENIVLEKTYWEKLLTFCTSDIKNTHTDFLLSLGKWKNKIEYTLIWSKSRNKTICFSNNKIPSEKRNQFIRRLLAEEVNQPWNWLAYEGINNIKKTYEYFPYQVIKL